MKPVKCFYKVIRTRFGGVLSHGFHPEGNKACALEAAHAAVGDPWSDHADLWPNIQPINDSPWSSNEMRTRALVPLIASYWDWSEWTPEGRKTVMRRVVHEMIQHVIADLPGLTEEIRAQCHHAKTLKDDGTATSAAVQALMTTKPAGWGSSTEGLAPGTGTATEEEARLCAAEWTARKTEWAVHATSGEEAAFWIAKAAHSAAITQTSQSTTDHLLTHMCQIWIRAVTTEGLVSGMGTKVRSG